jgi:hypothetical protein
VFQGGGVEDVQAFQPDLAERRAARAGLGELRYVHFRESGDGEDFRGAGGFQKVGHGDIGRDGDVGAGELFLAAVLDHFPRLGLDGEAEEVELAEA